MFGLNFGVGRASDAVEESMGVASDEESTAGTEEDFASLARLAASSAAGETRVARGLLSLVLADDCESGEGLSGALKGDLFQSVNFFEGGGGDLGGGATGFWSDA